MTSQRDPEHPNEKVTPNSVARGTEGFGLIPIFAGIGILFLLVVGIFWSAGDRAPRQADVPTQNAPK